MQKHIEILSSKNVLRGMLHIPEGISKAPLVIILHGFGGNKMGPHFMFVKLSRELEKLGIASIRVDFAGSGESDGNFIDMTISRELEDAENILNYVKTLDIIDTDRIGVMGFSMGGAIASLLAANRKADIESLLLLSPAGSIGKILTDDFIGEGYTKFIQDGYYEYEGSTFGRAFVEEAVTKDFFGLAAEYDKKVYLIHGNKDEVVPIEDSITYQKVYKASPKLKVIDGADHLFSTNRWEQEVLSEVSEYFKSTL